MQARKLTDAELAEYRETGWMAYGPILTDQEVSELSDYVTHLAGNLAPGKRPEAMDMAHVGDPYLLGVCANPRILDVVEQLVGPDIVLFASHLICKRTGDGQAVPWHQDATFWPLEPMEVVTLWLAVDESTVENGCMRVVPGTHKQGPIDHQRVADLTANVLDQEVAGVDEQIRRAVDIELRPGECSFHEPYLLHGSNPNNSSKRRCGYTMRFMPATTRLAREQEFYRSHPLYLLRGEDRIGHNRYTKQ